MSSYRLFAARILLPLAWACVHPQGGPPSLPITDHAVVRSPSAALLWPIRADRPEPPIFLDGAWLLESDAILHLTASVYRTFPSAIRSRRRYPVRIVPDYSMGNTSDAPITLFNGFEWEVMLHTPAQRWSQYAYQLAHELCHVLINSPVIDGLSAWRDHLQMPNRWLEESLCQMSAFFALPRVADEWDARPPFAGASPYAHSLRDYAATQWRDAAPLTSDTSFSAWFAKRVEPLRIEPYDRPTNARVAAALLPLFEQQPGLWVCLTYLEAVAASDRSQLDTFLRGWKIAAPDSCRSGIDAFARVLGFTLRD